jgi:hypothetical protein
MPVELLIALLLGAYGFSAGGYAFTFLYMQSATKGLWAGIEKMRDELKAEVKEMRDNDIAHLEERVKNLENR